MADTRIFYVEDWSLWFHVDDPDDPMDPQIIVRHKDVPEAVWALLTTHPKVRPE